MTTGVAPIRCDHVEFAYPRGIHATKDLDLVLERGDLLCLLGPNGAGKTTLIRQLVGDLKPTSGTVRVFGEDPRAARAAVKRRMGIIPQNAGLFPTLSVLGHLRSFAAMKGVPRRQVSDAVASMVAECDLQALLPRKAGSLSGGQQRRVLFALALLGDPDILVLDEPTVGLDPEARNAIWASIEDQRRRGKTILLTTHYLEEAERLASRIGFLSGGVLTHEGPVTEFYTRLGKSVRLVEGEGAPSPGKVHLLDSPGEAQAFARDLRLASYSIGRVSLEDVYFRLAGQTLSAEGSVA